MRLSILTTLVFSAALSQPAAAFWFCEATGIVTKKMQQTIVGEAIREEGFRVGVLVRLKNGQEVMRFGYQTLKHETLDDMLVGTHGDQNIAAYLWLGEIKLDSQGLATRINESSGYSEYLKFLKQQGAIKAEIHNDATAAEGFLRKHFPNLITSNLSVEPFGSEHPRHMNPIENASANSLRHDVENVLQSISGKISNAKAGAAPFSVRQSRLRTLADYMKLLSGTFPSNQEIKRKEAFLRALDGSNMTTTERSELAQMVENLTAFFDTTRELRHELSIELASPPAENR